MTKGLGKFEYYFIQLDTILKKAERTKNPAQFLYENDGRTIVFMLEGLAKLYSGLHNTKKFEKIKASYKLLEDLLGKIDHCDSIINTVSKNKIIPATVKKYFADNKKNYLDQLNTLLLKKKWIGHSPTRTEKQRKRIKKANWEKPEKEIELIKKYYQNNIVKINAFYKDTCNPFTDMETQVHELRRKLRWLSIYPHALQGNIQLVNIKNNDTLVKKYLTKEVINSPYNKFPSKGNNENILQLNQSYFYALSFTIAALGDIKDEGLLIEAISEALQATEKLSKTAATKKACLLIKQKENQTGLLLKNAQGICKQFFEENNLNKLLVN